MSSVITTRAIANSAVPARWYWSRLIHCWSRNPMEFYFLRDQETLPCLTML